MGHQTNRSTILWGIALLALAYIIGGGLHAKGMLHHGGEARGEMMGTKGTCPYAHQGKQQNKQKKMHINTNMKEHSFAPKTLIKPRNTPLEKTTMTGPVRLRYMQEHNLTDAQTLDAYDPDVVLTRRDILPTLKLYAEQQGMQWIEGSDCTFDDIDALTEEEQETIVHVCSYEFLRGTKGNFMPDRELTQAEMLAMVIRGNYGYLNERLTPWYYAYYEKAVNLGLVKPNLDATLFSDSLTKKDLALWLYAADNLKEVSAETILTK